MEQLEPQSVAYNICRASQLFGNLNISALQASLNEIISRHETLRTAFRLVDGRPVQVVEPSQDIALELADLRSIPEVDRDVEIRRRIKAESECPFDLSAGLLLKAKLLRVGDQEHVLILMTHHSASDAWSMGILTREIWTLYEAFSNGKPSPLERLPVQYSDYAVWQRNWLQGDVLDTQLAYWKKQLENLSILNLPTDRPRTPHQSFRGARVAVALPQVLTAFLNELSNRIAVTPFMTLLTALQVLLYRYTGQEDVVIGSPIANRRRPEIEGLIGFFANTMVLRADLSGNPSFRELLSKVKDTCVAADTNQDLPFEKLVQDLRPERDLSRNPLFQVMFTLQNATNPFTGIPSLRVEPIELETTRSPFDLSLFLREREGKYIGYIEYSTDLFNPDRIEHMAGHYQTLLEAIVADPDQCIGTAPILTQSERHQILVEWNDTTADYPKNKCIHQLFEEQVERSPDAIAIEFEGQRLTYRELNARANKLAHHLIDVGVGSEKLVGICVERSVEMVVGLLGILKAGGAYVPLDPSYPKERLEFMLQDAQISVVVTQEKYLETCQRSTVSRRPTYVCIDRDWEVISRESGNNFSSGVSSNNLAYVIYTSGSTGTPKGVAIEHRNTVNFLQWAMNVYGSDELAGVLASTSICFDLSVFELFVPLTCGSKVILAGNALCLYDLAAKQEITLINTVPSVVAQVLALGPLPESVRVVNLAGEPLKAELVEQLYKEGNVEKVYDLYGPSETTTYSTFTLRTKEGPTTIGRPIANTLVFILDSSLQLVPVGVEGELYIGGDGMARGYLNRPELTSERFVPYPFSADPDNRLYRTGDRARYRPDGNIEFLGRNDNQVKIRGYRIELGEIEAAVNQYPAIKESVVVARDGDWSGEKDLIGYVIPKKPSPVAISGLRNFLRDKLPDYMVPSLFVELEILPLTPNGKVDRNGLPSPEGARPPGLDHGFVAPRTEIEELVAQTWREVLKIEAVGIHDNFFELGGHSLLASQIISRVREAFDKDVPLAALFDTPTVAGLTATIEKTISVQSHDLPPVIRAPRDEPLPLSMNQEHLWRLDQLMPGTHFFNMPYVYQVKGQLNVQALEKTLSEIVHRHEALRTVFTDIDETPVQIVEEVDRVRLSYKDLRSDPADEVPERAATLVLEERQLPFDLVNGPLLRVTLIRLTESDYLLLVTMHHIISDEWSMRIFLRELTALYEAFSLELPSPLSYPIIQYGDYVRWERQVLSSDLMERKLEYCKEQLKPLCVDRRPIAQHSDRDCRMPNELLDFDEKLSEDIKRLAGAEKCTPFIVMTAGLSLALSCYSKEREILIATLNGNRGRPELEDIIGHFINTVILRIKMVGDLSIRQHLRWVRAQVLEAFAHGQLPFEAVARRLEAEGMLRQSLIHVLLDYQHSTSEVKSSAGLTFAPFPVRNFKTLPEMILTNFNMVIRVIETSTKLLGSVNYKADSGMGRWASGVSLLLTKIMRQMVDVPNETLNNVKAYLEK